MPGDLIDLRSDTVTRPTPAMREAMARAEVGDDQFGEDPTVNRLQERVAAMLGHQAGLWFPTGTMANQVAIRTLTRPGDEIIAPREAHILWHETGGAAANSGVQVSEIGQDGEAIRMPPGVRVLSSAIAATVVNRQFAGCFPCRFATQPWMRGHSH